MLDLAILFHRMGPYHHARLRAAGARCRLTAIELSAVDDTYAWSPVAGAASFARRTLFADRDIDRQRRVEVTRRVRASRTATRACTGSASHPERSSRAGL